jgi:hypothetical protein
MYFCSLMEQKCYIVSKQSTTTGNVPVNGSFRPVRGSSTRIVQNQGTICPRWGQRYDSTTRTCANAYIFGYFAKTLRIGGLAR